MVTLYVGSHVSNKETKSYTRTLENKTLIKWQSKESSVPDQKAREDSQNLETELLEKENLIKSLKEQIENLKLEEQEQNEENEIHIISLKAQLEYKDSRIRNLHEQSIALRQENKQLKEAVTEFENNKSISEDLDKSNLETQDSENSNSDIEDNGESEIDVSGNQISFIKGSKQLKEEMELSDNLDKQPKDSDFNDKKNYYNNGSATVTIAQVYGNSEQNRDEIVQHEDHYDYGEDD